MLLYAGSRSSRKIAQQLCFFYNLKDPNGRIMQLPKFNVLLTSYESLRTDFKELSRIEWQAIVIDEGQRMKNNNTKFFKLCLALQTRFRLLLSGTPL